MAELADRIPGNTIFASYANDIRDRAVMRYLDAANRDASVPIPLAGDLAYLTVNQELTLYSGTDWLEFAQTIAPTIFTPLTVQHLTGGEAALNLINSPAGDAGAIFVASGTDGAFILRQYAGFVQTDRFRSKAPAEASEAFELLDQDGTNLITLHRKSAITGPTTDQILDLNTNAGAGANVNVFDGEVGLRLNNAGGGNQSPTGALAFGPNTQHALIYGWRYGGSTRYGIKMEVDSGGTQGVLLELNENGRIVVGPDGFLDVNRDATGEVGRTIRNIIIGTGTPLSGDGDNGDMFFQFT